MLVNPSQPCQASTRTISQRRLRLNSSSNRPALVLILNVIIKYERSQEVSFISSNTRSISRLEKHLTGFGMGPRVFRFYLKCYLFSDDEELYCMEKYTDSVSFSCSLPATVDFHSYV